MKDKCENGYAMSLRQQASWIREAINLDTDKTQRIELQDIDTDELDAAADEIEALMARIAELEKSNGHLRNNIRGFKRNMFRKNTRIETLERALDKIIMGATSRNHAIDIARRARA